jgi:hypothetical protein
MSNDPVEVVKDAGRAGLSLDVWAVLLAFVLAVLVRAGVLKTIPW